MNRVSYFEFSALNMDRAKSFWEKTFGWKFEKYGGMDYYAVKTGEGDGIDGGLSMREKDNQVVNNIEVSDLDQIAADIVKNGGKILVPKTPIPGMGSYIIFVDSEDNTFSAMQNE